MVEPATGPERESWPTFAEIVEPGRTALLVIDVQRYFARTEPGAMYPPVEGVLDTLRRFINACRERGVLVVRIQAIIPDEATHGVWRRHFRDRWARPSPLAPDQLGAEFHPGFEPQPGDLLVTKTRYSSFHGTSLEGILRGRGIQTVLVGGLTTDVCVSTTARDAFQHEFDTITLSDCCAERTQARHESGLATLAATFGTVCTSEDVLAAWGAVTVATPAS